MRIASLAVNTRDLILDAIERLLARYGYRKTNMEDVAREAGIGKGTIYLYFPSKEEVALCSIDRVVARVHDKLRALAASEAPVPQRLREMLATRILVRFDSVQAYSESLDDLFASLRPAYMARRKRYFETEAKLFVPVLREGRRQKCLTVTNALATANTLLLATNSLLPYSLSARELGERADIARRTYHLADLLLHGLLRRE
jgi:AcrR family transcriptional regulator